MIKLIKRKISGWIIPQIIPEIEKGIDTKITALTLYTHECDSKHQQHEYRNQQHDNLYLKHEALLNTVVATQANMAETQKTMSEAQKSMSESLTIFSEFVKKHEPNFDIVAKVILALGGVKSAVGWLAAVIGGLGIIIGSMLATWLYLSANIPVPNILDKF